MTEPIIMNVNGWLLTVRPRTGKSSTFHSRKAERVAKMIKLTDDQMTVFNAPSRNTQILRERYLAQYMLAATASARHHLQAARNISIGCIHAAEYWQLEARHWHQRAVRARLLWELCKTDMGASIARMSENSSYGKFYVNHQHYATIDFDQQIVSYGDENA